MPFVCPSCIQHPSLARFIIANATANECSYCGKAWKRSRAMPLRELLAHIRERIEMEYEDAANSVGCAEDGYQLSTMDGYELLDELGLCWDLNSDQLRDDLTPEFMDCAWYTGIRTR